MRWLKASRIPMMTSSSRSVGRPSMFLSLPPMPPAVGSFMFMARRMTKKPMSRATLSAKEMSHSGAPPSCSWAAAELWG
jgi:hypothetical protein